MSEVPGKIPEKLLDIWDNLSYQMQAHIRAFGLRKASPESGSLTRDDFTPDQWRGLSFQMRGQIVAKKSMDEEVKAKKKEDWKRLGIIG